MSHNLTVLQDASEVVHYDTPGLPLYIRYVHMSEISDFCTLSHWHDDWEWIRVYSGHMFYSINGIRILMKPGDCLWVNARQMHFNYSSPGQECDYLCVLVQMPVLTGNAILCKRYFQPVLDAAKPEFLHFSSGDVLLPQLQKQLDDVWDNKVQSGPSTSIAYELRAAAILNQIWASLWDSGKFSVEQSQSTEARELTAQRDMVSYIYKYYTEPLTLNDIAAAGKVCRSRCCQLFQKYAQNSPIIFLNQYRLEVSRDLLTSTDLKITEIAMSCGFNHPSYYAKLFQRYYHCTPLEYRIRNRGSHT